MPSPDTLCLNTERHVVWCSSTGICQYTVFSWVGTHLSVSATPIIDASMVRMYSVYIQMASLCKRPPHFLAANFMRLWGLAYSGDYIQYCNMTAHHGGHSSRFLHPEGLDYLEDIHHSLCLTLLNGGCYGTEHPRTTHHVTGKLDIGKETLKQLFSTMPENSLYQYNYNYVMNVNCQHQHCVPCFDLAVWTQTQAAAYCVITCSRRRRVCFLSSSGHCPSPLTPPAQCWSWSTGHWRTSSELGTGSPGGTLLTVCEMELQWIDEKFWIQCYIEAEMSGK